MAPIVQILYSVESDPRYSLWFPLCEFLVRSMNKGELSSNQQHLAIYFVRMDSRERGRLKGSHRSKGCSHVNTMTEPPYSSRILS
jgi:hypothetical protein